MTKLMTQREAAAWCRFDVRTLQRLEEDGRGPRRIQLTERRVAYREEDLIAWIDSRASTAKHAA